MKKIHLGVNLSFALNRYPEPEEWARIASKELGLKYVQFFSDLLDPLLTPPSLRSRFCRQIRKVAEENKLKIHSLFTGTSTHCFNLLLHPEEEMRRAALKWYEGAIEIASEMGTFGLGSFLGAFSKKDEQDEKRKKALIEELIDHWHYLSRLAKKNGLKFILFEPMSCAREVPSTIAETRWFYQRLNEGSDLPFYLCLDLGHGRAFSGSKKDADPYAWLEELIQKTLTIHLQQTDRMASRHWPFTEEFNQRGKIEAKKVMEILQKKGEGEIFLFLEILYPPFEPYDDLILDDLKKSAAYWKKSLSEIPSSQDTG